MRCAFRRLSGCAPHAKHTHNPRARVHGEEHQVDVWLATLAQDANRPIGFRPFWCDRAPFRMLVERQHGALQAAQGGAIETVPGSRPRGRALRVRPQPPVRLQRGIPCLRRRRSKTCFAGLVPPAFTSARPRRRPSMVSTRSAPSPRVVCFTVPSTDRLALLERLANLRITKAHLQPTLPKVAQQLWRE